MDLVVFGAGGRAGRRVVAEALRRGHRVTAVVRDPAKYAGELDGARVVAGDVTDAASVAAAAAGQEAAVNAAAEVTADPHAFFTSASRALADGLAGAGVGRLVAVGLSSVLPGALGVPLMDEPGYPSEYRAFFLGHAAGLAELEKSDLDWVYAAPAGDFDHTGASTGRYRVAPHSSAESLITYADFALALLDELESPKHHGTSVSFTAA
ncbi:NAD(P)-dependent oxidoreductase [Actinocorallia sp. A-T 12471]|uniref:NAD(P)-dependent oxidoreductase n=1 Tax=Actinocorallia sp. A-T 12471 TaxID=3089813 RepID=UPI0029CE4618|nr:NAD(P)H-binding protein [Actinocorallia sp. A-T 12471]MDX6742236.1 NAD(P)H-binding protein [Actinocorallia sp. A-T 12471]